MSQEAVGAVPRSPLPSAEEMSRDTMAADARVTLEPLIEIRGLKKAYGLKPILRGLDLTVHDGESMALLGANGAGKTTLLRILGCLTRPDAGNCTIASFDTMHDAQVVRSIVGVVAHQPYLYEELTVLENLLFFGRLYNVANVHERALDLLQHVGLERRRKERVATLSRGQLQRLSWARALMHSPRVLLLDEPDTGLDQEGYILVDTLLHEHWLRGGTTLFTTHQPERALQLASRVALLSGGRIVYQQEAQALTLDELQRVYGQLCREKRGR